MIKEISLLSTDGFLNAEWISSKVLESPFHVDNSSKKSKNFNLLELLSTVKMTDG